MGTGGESLFREKFASVPTTPAQPPERSFKDCWQSLDGCLTFPSPGMAVPRLVRKAWWGAVFSSACPYPEFPFRDTQAPTPTSLICPSPQRFPSRRQSLKAASAPGGSLDGRTGSVVRDFFIRGDLWQHVFVFPPWVFMQLWVKIPFFGERGLQKQVLKGEEVDDEQERSTLISVSCICSVSSPVLWILSLKYFLLGRKILEARLGVHV